MVKAKRSPYTHICVNNKCIRKTIEVGDVDLMDVNGCLLTCDPFANLWPIPNSEKKPNITKSLFNILPNSITFGKHLKQPSDQVNKMLSELFEIFMANLYHSHPEYRGDAKSFPHNGAEDTAALTILVNLETDVTVITHDTDESYSLDSQAISQDSLFATINAHNYFGARHGMETLGQLIAYNSHTNMLQIPKGFKIEDRPAYSHRGVMIDTSRNYFDVHFLKRLIDGLSYSKMNILHWHITDTHSFPMYLEKVPELARYGAYSANEIYTSADIKEIINYARVRGVKILPEFDAPAHVGNGWQFAEHLHPDWGKLVLCLNKQPWSNYCLEPPCGQFNVVNNMTYSVLGDVYEEMFEMFDRDLFHMGGDEVSL